MVLFCEILYFFYGLGIQALYFIRNFAGPRGAINRRPNKFNFNTNQKKFEILLTYINKNTNAYSNCREKCFFFFERFQNFLGPDFVFFSAVNYLKIIVFMLFLKSSYALFIILFSL